MPHPPSREQFFALLQGTLTVEEIEVRRRHRMWTRACGRRQNEIEAVLDAMPKADFIRFGAKQNVHRSWDSVLGENLPHRHPTMSQMEILHRSRVEWTARKWALRKVWERRVEVADLPPRRPSASERAVLARAAHGGGKSKNR